MDVAVLTHAMRVLSCASQVRSNAICVESRREGRLSGGISPLLISKFPNAGRALDSYFFKSFLRKSYNKVRIEPKATRTNRVDGIWSSVRNWTALRTMPRQSPSIQGYVTDWYTSVVP